MRFLIRIASSVSISLKSLIRSRSSIVWVLVLPLVLSSVSGILLSAIDTPALEIHIQDLDDTSVSHRIVQEIGEQYDIVMVSPDADIDEYIENVKPIAVLVIPDGFQNDWFFNAMTNGPRGVVHYEGKSYVVEWDKTANPDSMPSGTPSVYITGEAASKSEVDKYLPKDQGVYNLYFPTVASVVIMMLVLSMLISQDVDMRNRGLKSVMRYTGLRKHEWVISQIIWVILPASFGYVLSLMVFNLYSPLNISVWMIPMVVMSILACVPLASLVSYVVKDINGASVVSTLILVPMIQICGGIVPSTMLPDAINSIATYLPLTYMLSGFKDCMGVDSLYSMEHCMIVLGIMSAVLFVATLAVDAASRHVRPR